MRIIVPHQLQRIFFVTRGRARSRISPSILAASAALASPGPIAAAMSAAVVPGATSRAEPSGRVMRIMLDMGATYGERPARVQPPVVSGSDRPRR
jgi:hypothetical protein